LRFEFQKRSPNEALSVAAMRVSNDHRGVDLISDALPFGRL
jgi:hypothetical protein